MEKVKLTKSQAEEIERIKKVGHPVRWKEDGWHIDRDEKINQLTFNEYMEAIHKGYEVEPEFKVNDWIFINSKHHLYHGRSFQIHEIFESSSIDEKFAYKVIVGSDEMVLYERQFRHSEPQEIATEKERRWWAKHDREVEELRKSDIVHYDDHSWGGLYFVTSDVFKASNRKDSVRLFNKHRKNEITIEVSKLKVICFAEDRKDI